LAATTSGWHSPLLAIPAWKMHAITGRRGAALPSPGGSGPSWQRPRSAARIVVKHIHMPENTAVEAVETEKQWRTRAQVAQHLQVSARTIGHWMQRGILPFSKTGHLVRFELNHCDRAVERFRVESRPRPAKDSAGHTRRWRTKQQVATHLNISLRTVTSIMRRRIVPYLKIGGVVRLDLLEVDRVFKQLGR